MQIKLADINDVDSLFELNEQFNGSGSNTKELIYESILNNNQEMVFVAMEDEKAIGFCCVQLFKSMCYDENYAEITELFIKDGYRNKGIGTALISYAEDYFKAQNIKSYQLFTGNDNKIAQSFYEKHGYHKSDELMYRKRF